MRYSSVRWGSWTVGCLTVSGWTKEIEHETPSFAERPVDTGLAVVAFFASTIFKMIPRYFDYMSMEKIITAIETDRAGEARSSGDFYAHVSKGMQVDNLCGI